MKRLVLFGGIFLMTAIFSSCKKEVIQPNNRYEVLDCDSTNEHKIINRNNPDTPNSGGDITDPNDDDYSKRRPVKAKG